MWLENVVVIITFMFCIFSLIPKIQKRNKVFVPVVLALAIIFEIVYIIFLAKGSKLTNLLQALILLFAYLLPMVTIILSNTKLSFRLKLLYAVAKVSYAFGKYEFCAGILDGAIKRDKNGADYYFLRGKALEKMKETSKARDMFFYVVDIDKTNKEAYVKLAKLLDLEKKIDTALIMLAQVLKIYPDYFPAKEMMGIIYSELGRDNEAQSIYEELVKEKTATYNTYYNLGIIYSKQNKLDKAIDAYKQALEKNKKLYEANYALGRLYYIREDYLGSIEELTKALKEEKIHGMVYFALSMSYIKIEDLERAVECLEKAVSIDKDYLKLAKQSELFDVIELDITRLEDENKELITVTYDDQTIKENDEN